MDLVFFSKILIVGTPPSWQKNFGDVVKKGWKPGFDAICSRQSAYIEFLSACFWEIPLKRRCAARNKAMVFSCSTLCLGSRASNRLTKLMGNRLWSWCRKNAIASKIIGVSAEKVEQTAEPLSAPQPWSQFFYRAMFIVASKQQRVRKKLAATNAFLSHSRVRHAIVSIRWSKKPDSSDTVTPISVFSQLIYLRRLQLVGGVAQW